MTLGRSQNRASSLHVGPHHNPESITAEREGVLKCCLYRVALFRGSSRFESLILSHNSRFTCECNNEEINDDDDDDDTSVPVEVWIWRPTRVCDTSISRIIINSHYVVEV